jgi:nicotinamide mononucleotide transporter
MPITNALQIFFTAIRQTPMLEWMGVAFGVAEVLMARANKIALYPCGIISVLISSYIFYQSGLYAESLLNLYYLAMSIYGWWVWARQNDQPQIAITHAGRRDWQVTAWIVGGGFAVLCFALDRWTDSTVPAWDAWVSATAWAGMWLLARRKVENWLLLNISNAFAIPLLLYKGLPLYAVLTLFLFIIAVFGFFDWNKMAKKTYGGYLRR